MRALFGPPQPGEERELFLKLLEASPHERAGLLDTECAGRHALRQRVEELLLEQDDLEGFMETPALRAGAESSGVAGGYVRVTEKPGDHIGRFKLIQKIGEGGCGVVYLAEQQEPVRRTVALKIIKLGMDTRSVITRFQAERQALAMMDHPNIAKVLDAGATDTGRPFFVMEMVRGVRITDYCNDNRLDPEARLHLFIQVCQAIQHAHQKGIIHRDIKPSNILVTLHDPGSPGVPKVIDFGIAKATEQRLTEQTLVTESHSFIGTPAYMSPEQAEIGGLDIDTRSDIYALGVLLYELLVGQPPFDAQTLIRIGLDGCRRTICQVEPLRPSTRLSSLSTDDLASTADQHRTEISRLISLVKGDLDWIVMKCLEKDRTRRYETANALALDVQCFLNDEPILARPPSKWYRVQKTLSRHRGAFAAAAAVAATLVVGAGVSTWQAVRATRAENRAHAAKAQESMLRQQAEREKASARLNEYVADINLAQQSLAAGNYGRAVQLLAKHQAEAGEADLRGFEWRYLWKLCKGDPHFELPLQERAVEAIAVSPSGEFVVIGGRDEFCVWNQHTTNVVTRLPKSAFSAAFFPDGSRFVTASTTTVRIWNTSDWKNDHALPRNSAPVALSADGSRLATTSREGVRIWDTTTWEEVRLLRRIFGPIALSPDGQTVATDTPDGIALWSVEKGNQSLVLQDSTDLFLRTGPWFRREGPLAFSPDGKEIVAAQNTLSDEGVFVLTVWDAQSGDKVAIIPGDSDHIEHAGVITSLAFSADGKTLATASLDHSIRLWDFPARQRLAALQGHLSEVLALSLSVDGATVVSGGKDGEVKLWSAHPQDRGDILTGVRHPLLFSPDGQKLVGLTRKSSVVFLNLATGEIEQQIQMERGRRRFTPIPTTFALSADLRTVVQAMDDGHVLVTNTQIDENVQLKVSDGSVEIVALSPDGQVLITRGRNWSLRRWTLPQGTNTLWRAAAFKAMFSPDGSRLVTLGRGNVFELWDAETLESLGKLGAEVDPSFTVAFSHDGTMLAAVCNDDVIRLWDAATHELLGSFIGHKQAVRSVAFSADNKTLATASDDSTLKFWNVATQQELLNIRQLGAPLTGLMFSPDGQLLVGGSGAFSPSGGLQFFSTTLELRSLHPGTASMLHHDPENW